MSILLNPAPESASPLVSIVIPFRNAARTLPSCLESIRAQTLTDYELLAIDDGSQDGSRAIVSEWAEGDSRIRILDNLRPGLVSALNLGSSCARARFVARMDADDLMRPQRLALQYDYLRRRKHIDLVACQVHLFPGDRVQNGYREYVRWQNRCLSAEEISANIYVESPLAHPSVMFRREAVLSVGGYRHGPFPEDYDLWLRMHSRGYRMEKLPRVLLDWRESDNRTSRVDPRYSRDAFDRLRATFLARDPRVEANRGNLVFWGAGRKTRKRCQHLLSQGYEANAWIDIDPKKIGNRVNGVPVVAPGWLRRKPKPFVLCYVSNHGAREEIAGDLERIGYRQAVDYLMVG